MGGRHDCFAQATPGLERLVAAELGGLGLRPGRVEPGGVAFRATTRQLYAANLGLRTANRVLVRLGGFTATTFADLERRLTALDPGSWLAPDVRPVVRVSSSRSALYHTGAVAERVAGALGGGDPSSIEQPERPERPEQLVVVRIVADRVLVSLDSSGEALHRRGWRQDGAKAPLRETLAAALLLASGWDPRSPLVDPLCGSGTIAIEAALAARDLAPGLGRVFAFQHWSGFEPGTWASALGEARQRMRPPGSGPRIAASDRDAGAVRAARANAERAGVGDDVEIDCRSLSAVELPVADDGEGGWIVTNPPYGHRLHGGRGDLRDLYAVLGRLARDASGPGWGAALLVADPVLAGHTGLQLEERMRTSNGAIPVRLLVSLPGGRSSTAAGRTGAGRARPARRPGARRGAAPAPAADRHPPPADRTG